MGTAAPEALHALAHGRLGAHLRGWRGPGRPARASSLAAAAAALAGGAAVARPPRLGRWRRAWLEAPAPAVA
eukprot:4421006-Alexandrium_andersonii.AAC.1